MNFDYDPTGEEIFDEVYDDCGTVYGDFERDYSDCDIDDYFDDLMDGDHGSALAYAGWGTDEDYGYYGDESF